MTERKLASIQCIAEIKDIENADAIQAFRVNGWWVVDKKDAHKVGDLVVYLEVDSWVPTELASFLSKGQEPREYNGVKGERLKTIRLRGQVSQGLLLPLVETLSRLSFVRAIKEHTLKPVMVRKSDFAEVPPEIGCDLTDILGIQKWEAPLPAQLVGKAKGNFPTSLIPKTDQERIQNCFGEVQKRSKRLQTEKIWNAETQILEEHPTVVPADFQEPTYEVTMKLDGSSCTIFRWEGELRVCSRNLELKINDENKDNSFVKKALELGDYIPNGFAFQGELAGPDIQNNREGFSSIYFCVFDVFDIQKYEYLKPEVRRKMCDKLGLSHVPVLHECFVAPYSIEDALVMATGPSIKAKLREGIVFKCNEDPSFSFKVISNEWLLKNGE